MVSNNQYFEHSGTIGSLGNFYLILLGLPGTILLGSVYGTVTHFSPFVTIAFMVFFGLGIGYLVYLCGKWGKIRNPDFMFFIGIVNGIIGIYVSWVFWIYALSDYEFLIIFPPRLFSVMASIAQQGAWSIFDFTPKEIILYLIWTIEAILIILITASFSRFLIKSTPFCERCNAWVKEKETKTSLYQLMSPDTIRSQLEHNDYSSVLALHKTGVRGIGQFKLELIHCPTCQELYLLCLKSATLKVINNKTKEVYVNIVHNLIIEPEIYNTIKEKLFTPTVKNDEDPYHYVCSTNGTE